MVCLAELSLVAWMADGSSELSDSMRKLALVSVATVAVLAVGPTQLRLVPGGIDHGTHSSSPVVLPTNGRPV